MANNRYSQVKAKRVTKGLAAGATGGGGSITVSDTAPSSPSAGDLWFDSTVLRTYVYYNDGTSSQWVLSNPIGLKGPAGDAGAAGAAGADGADGSSVSIYATINDLPLTGNTAGDQAFVTAVNRFYIFNGAGWYSISLVNTNPSFTSVQDSDGGSTPFTLTTNGAATVVTITASDPEDVPLTYSYSVTSGSLTNGGGTTATVSQADNVFTITPSTTEAYAGTFELTFTASDGVNTATSANSFTLSFVTIIANSKYTTLLATAVDTSDNNNITDASTNNHSITVSGDAHAGTFSPYRSGGYSIYLPAINGGSEHNISFDHDTGFNFGSGDFTIEFSIYFPSATTGTDYLFQHGESTGSWNINTYNGVVNLFLNGISVGNDVLADSSNTISNNLNEWINYAIVRSGSTVTMYRNGTSIATKTSAQNANVGATLDTTNSEYLHINRRRAGIGDGTEFYFKDFRVTKGLARTISNDSEPLTSDANTSILVGSLPYIGDASSNAHSPTFTGTPSTKPFSPYDYTEYSATDNGGSVHFDGSSDNLSLTANSGFSLDGNFTIECWFNPSSITLDSQHPSILKIGTTQIYLNSSNNYVGFYYDTNDVVKSANSSITENQWYHVSVTRSGTLLTLFLNGVSVDTGNYTATFGGSSGTVYIGTFSGTGGDYHGYITDLRVVKGTAVYSGNFTSPTSPLSSSGASLHIKGTGASIIDKSQSANLKLFGNTTGSTTQAKFVGSKSMYFDGSGDGILCKGTQIPTGATESWTIEAWAYVTDTSTERQIFAQYSAGSSSTRFVFGVESAKFRVFNGGTSLYSLNAVSLNTWTHVAVTYNGSAAELYVDGISQGTLTLNRGVDDVDLQIGARNQGATQPWVGYIQDARVTKGLARYTTNFTPPTASLEG